jgi:hypothetical protein
MVRLQIRAMLEGWLIGLLLLFFSLFVASFAHGDDTLWDRPARSNATAERRDAGASVSSRWLEN